MNGSKVDASIADETLDLNGYTVFLIYNHITGKVFHAHFVPTALRARELDYNRFLGQFDLRIYPSVIQDTSYLTFAGRSDVEQLRYEQWYGSSLNFRRGQLLSDSAVRKSVVPRS